MNRVSGIAETALYVADLDRSRAFYTQVFQFDQVHGEGDRMIAFAIAPSQVLLLFRAGASRHSTGTPGGLIPAHDGGGNLHMAFAIESDAVPAWRTQLLDHNIAIESEVHCPRGGHSIYFRDPDHHLIELITPGCWPNS